MTFKEYQTKTQETAIYPAFGNMGIFYCVFGLTNEAGEVAGKVKKALRDDRCNISEERRKAIADEIGDVLWYCSQLAKEINMPLENIAWNNIEKLRSRKERDKIGGDGDKR